MRKLARMSTNDPVIEEEELLDANSDYVQVRLSNEREIAVSSLHLASLENVMSRNDDDSTQVDSRTDADVITFDHSGTTVRNGGEKNK